MFTVHNEWLNCHWPDLRILRNFSLVMVFASYAMLGFIPMLTFAAVSLPYGWPKTSFFNMVPRPKQFIVFGVVIFCFLVPVIISCATYFLIYFSVVIRGKTSYATLTEATLIELTLAHIPV